MPTLRYFDAILVHQTSRRATRRFHEIAPFVAIGNHAGCFARTNRMVRLPGFEQLENGRLESPIEATNASRPATARTVTHGFPAILPSASHFEAASAARANFHLVGHGGKLYDSPASWSLQKVFDRNALVDHARSQDKAKGPREEALVALAEREGFEPSKGF